MKVVKSLPGIDPNRVFLQGYSFGAISSLFAVDPNTPGAHDAKIAGLIAYFPYCYDNVASSVPTLVLIGEKDDWTPAALCQKVSDKELRGRRFSGLLPWVRHAHGKADGLLRASHRLQRKGGA